MKRNTPRTIKWFSEIIGYFAKGTGVESLSEIDRSLIEQWIVRGKLDKNWSAKTIRNRVSALRLFLDWCVKRGYMSENPILEIDLPKLPKKIPRHLSQTDAFMLLDWTKNFRYSYQFERKRAIAIISLFLFSGIRLQELLNLKLEDVQLENRIVFIRCGKGEKDRMIPINLDLSEALRDYVKDRDRLKKTCPFFFTSLTADSELKYQVVKRLVEKLRSKSGIYFTPHMLRHTFATLMLEGGCEIYALSKMLGHSDIKTTTIYLSATTHHLQEQITKHPLGLL